MDREPRLEHHRARLGRGAGGLCQQGFPFTLSVAGRLVVQTTGGTQGDVGRGKDI